MYENLLPWWLVWIDGRVLLLLTLTVYFARKAFKR